MGLEYYNDRYVPDEGPETARILFVGEAPGEQEYEQLKPFIGPSGDILLNVLARNGINRGEVRLANLSHRRPYNNKFEKLLGTEALKDGVRDLYQYIQDYRPTVIAALGSWPLAFLTGKKGIKKWRGSILSYINDESIKVIPTFHPAAVLRDRGLYPTFDIDIRRIISDSAFAEKRLPVRRYITDPRGLDLEEWTQKLCASEYLACDIETVKRSKHILCVGFAPSKDVGVCIVPTHAEGRRAIERILLSDAAKIFQFGTFDTLQLHDNQYLINDPKGARFERPYYWDTLLAQHAQVSELPRSLEYLTSIYTREPYYKTEGRGTIPDDAKGWSMKVDKQSLYVYNCKDCCTTFEVFEQQKKEILRPAPHGGWMDEDLVDSFDYSMSMLEVAHHISQSGLPIDLERRELLQQVLLKKWGMKQFILDRMTGYETNVRSPKLKNILYDKDKLGLPTRRNRDGGITTNEDAIVSLIAYCKDKLDSVSRPDAVLGWKVKLAVCQTILEIRGIRQVLSNYVLERMRDGTPRLSDDLRLRSTVKVGGTETFRWSMMKYVDGRGFNAQTLPRDPVEISDAELTTVDGVVRLKERVDQLLREEPDEDDVEAEEEAA
jgi:uracil-DNA glycosylase family 4